jgi:hypothetical protein
MYSRGLNGEDEGEPMLYVTQDCRDFVRTVPSLQNDEHKLEDIDTRHGRPRGRRARYTWLHGEAARSSRGAWTVPQRSAQERSDDVTSRAADRPQAVEHWTGPATLIAQDEPRARSAAQRRKNQGSAAAQSVA